MPIQPHLIRTRPDKGGAARTRMIVTVAAGLLAVVAMAGCGGSTSSAAGNVTTAAPASAPDPGPASGPGSAPAPAAACTPWAGLQYLAGAYLTMQQLASAEETGTDVGSAELAYNVDWEGLVTYWTELPAPYAEEVQNEVIAVTPADSSPAQLETGAADADALYTSIAGLCPGS
jgi:hypothetical protein